MKRQLLMTKSLIIFILRKIYPICPRYWSSLLVKCFEESEKGERRKEKGERREREGGEKISSPQMLNVKLTSETLNEKKL